MLEGTYATALVAGASAPRPAEVFDRLRALIMSGAIPPGQRVNIEDVARNWDVSPTPVREALASLEAEGLVVKYPQRGYRTSELLTRDELVELYELRGLLEPNAAAAAASRADADAVARIRAEFDTAASWEGAVTASELAAHDERLHNLIFDAAGNALVARTYQRTHCHLHIFRYAYSGTYGLHTVDEHRAIVDALASGDAPGAEAAMRTHLQTSLTRMLAQLRD